jgi:hypothetical protein
MYQTSTFVQSPKASAYFDTFCKHFARKLAVEKLDNEGTIEFGIGQGRVTLNNHRLDFTCTGTTLINLEMVRHIVDVHITRLGDFRGMQLDWKGDSTLNYAEKNGLYGNNPLPTSTPGLKIVGAGLGRTGTTSLKLALEMLLGGRCYHMAEVSARPDHAHIWSQAYNGKLPDWSGLFDGYAATVDWPGATFWETLMTNYPNALVVLSIRDPQSWWESCHETIFQVLDKPDATPEWKVMIKNMFAAHKLHVPIARDRAIKAFTDHNQKVMETVPEDRLLIWQASEGWDPLCKALQCAIPAEPFPRINTREQWQGNKE